MHFADMYTINIEKKNALAVQTFVEMVCKLFVGENVDEKLPSWIQPISNFGHQFTVVFHVLKHFCKEKMCIVFKL